VAVTPEEERRYTEIIDGILATANLETISRKKIREGLEAALGGKDLQDQKVLFPRPERTTPQYLRRLGG
jgi:upstream activation factor subunit UAF30